MRKKLLLLLIMLLSATMLLIGCGGNDANVKILHQQMNKQLNKQMNRQLKEFRVGLECGYPPFNWTQIDDSNGGIKIDGGQEYAGGYDVEIAKRIAEGLGRKLVIVKTEWDGLVPALTSGKIDAIIAGMSPTAERKETIDFQISTINQI